MKVRLHVVHGRANVKEIVLGRKTLIGRGAECNLKIASSQVSRRHCRIQVTDTQVLLTDLGGANGTLLHGTALPANVPTPLQPDDEVEIGPLRFAVRFERARAAASKLEDTVRTSDSGRSHRPPPTDVETVDFIPEDVRRAAAMAAAGIEIPPDATSMKPGDTVMDLNFAPVPKAEPEQETFDHPIAGDLLDETVLLNEDPPAVEDPPRPPTASQESSRPKAVKPVKAKTPDSQAAPAPDDFRRSPQELSEEALKEFFSQLQ